MVTVGDNPIHTRRLGLMTTPQLSSIAFFAISSLSEHADCCWWTLSTGLKQELLDWWRHELGPLSVLLQPMQLARVADSPELVNTCALLLLPICISSPFSSSSLTTQYMLLGSWALSSSLTTISGSSHMTATSSASLPLSDAMRSPLLLLLLPQEPTFIPARFT